MSWRNVAAELERFNEALKRASQSANEAADAQEDLADAAESTLTDAGVRGSGEGGLTAPGDDILSFQSRLNTSPFLWGQAANAGLNFVNAAAQNQYVQQQSADIGRGGDIGGGLLSGGTGFLLDSANSSPLGRLATTLSGVNAGRELARNAGAQTAARLGELAEAGFDITNEDIERDLRITQERSARGQAVRARVNQIATGPENLAVATAETNRLLGEIRDAIRGGGGAQ